MAKRKTTKVVRGVLRGEAQRVSKEIWYYEEPEGLCVVDYVLHSRLREKPKSKPMFAYLPWRMLIASVERYKKATASKPRRQGKTRQGGGPR